MMNKKTLSAVVVLGMLMLLTVLVGCGDSSGGEESSEFASASIQVADPVERYAGSWTVAAVETQGLIMAGDLEVLTDMNDVNDVGVMNLNADGSGTITLEEKDKNNTVMFNWAISENNDKAFVLRPEETTGILGKTARVTYKDNALFMEVNQDDQNATIIFTRDGRYAGAKEISMNTAAPIVSRDELLGQWKMTGMNLMGVSMYGSVDDLKKICGGIDTTVTFKEDGVAEMTNGDGTWVIDRSGATLLPGGAMRTNPCPVKKLYEDIVIDMSEVFGGTEFLMLLSKK